LAGKADFGKPLKLLPRLLKMTIGVGSNYQQTMEWPWDLGQQDQRILYPSISLASG
jgi:hypothetical protein